MSMIFVAETLAMLAIAIAPLANSQTAVQNSLVTVSIDSIDLKDVGSDRILFDVHTHVTASRKLNIKSVSFEKMHMGSLPIFMNPIESHLTLPRDTSIALPSIPLTIFYRDVDSLEPLEQAVRDGQTTVTGYARADLDVNLLEKAVLGEWSSRAAAPISVTIPVNTPGGVLGRGAALAALDAGQIALNLGSSALHTLRQSQKEWEQTLRTRYIPSVVVAESRYSLRLRDGRQVKFAVRGTGFRISEDKFILTAEMVEPWKYDLNAVTALQSGDATLMNEGRDLLVWPADQATNPSASRSFSQGQIEIERVSGKAETLHVPGEKGNTSVQLQRRDSNENYAVLHFTRRDAYGPAAPVASDQVRHNETWSRLSLFRVDEDGQLEILSTAAERQGDRIRLTDPVDDCAFGSLLIEPTGAVGMVQGEHSGMILRPNW